MAHEPKKPSSLDNVTLEVMGQAIKMLEHEVLQNAATAVLHYFRVEQGRASVTLGEFSQALEDVLNRMGIKIDEGACSVNPQLRVAETDLCALVNESGEGCEMVFFSRLREALRAQMGTSPEVVRFSGLRGCVKLLLKTNRWNQRCQKLNDQIVEYLRNCLMTDFTTSSCALVVR